MAFSFAQLYILVQVYPGIYKAQTKSPSKIMMHGNSTHAYECLPMPKRQAQI